MREHGRAEAPAGCPRLRANRLVERLGAADAGRVPPPPYSPDLTDTVVAGLAPRAG